MKKFFTLISHQNNEPVLYQAVDNPALQLDRKVKCPIMTAIAGYVCPGEEIRVIAVLTDTEVCRNNLEEFDCQVRQLCEEKGCICPAGVEAVFVPEADDIFALKETFRKLITCVDDNDELFACMTYGTKPTTNAVMMALQYAYRIKSNASISCVLYGQLRRPSMEARVYDLTAMVRLDEIVHLLAATKHPDPDAMIDLFLTM